MNEFDTLKTVFNFLADNGMCNTAAEMWDEAVDSELVQAHVGLMSEFETRLSGIGTGDVR